MSIMKTSKFKAAVALLLVSLVLAGCYNPEADTSLGGYTAGQMGNPPVTPGLEPVKIPTPTTPPAVNPVSPVLRISDMVTIDWFDTPSPIPQYKERIRDDGKLILPYNIIVQAAGRTTAQLQDEIRSAYVP